MDTIQRGSAPQREATLLQVFLREAGYDVNPDGDYGPGTERAVRQFQIDHGLVVDGVAGQKTWTTLFALHPDLLQQITQRWLSQQQISDFAAAHQLEVPVVRAVYSVEAAGMGFIGLQPKILFEGHVFWRELVARGKNPSDYTAGNEDILFPSYNPRSYVGGLAEYDRLNRARAIDDSAALRAASWGLFQVLGYHAETLGYADVQDFVAKMSQDEGQQLEAFGRFITVNRKDGRPLIDWLRAKDWTRFAAGYNGPAYAQNQYDQRLAEAYATSQAQQA
jgi:hypothetical protein